MRDLLLVIVTVLFGLNSYGQEIKTTEQILKTACEKAGKENKNVFVKFKASWCGWCKKMEASMNDITTKKYFDDNYVTVYLIVQESPANKMLETPGALRYMQTLKADAAGLPFFVIIDKKGKVLGDSFVNNQNLGCPTAPDEVASFISLIKKTSPIDETGLDAISKRFKLNSPQQ
ncbi:MAG: thioredoxin family protein [Ferruginibacter sp.]